MGLADPIPGDPPRGDRRCIVGRLLDNPDQWGFDQADAEWLAHNMTARAGRHLDPGASTFTYVEMARRVNGHSAPGAPRISVSVIRNHSTKECGCHL